MFGRVLATPQKSYSDTIHCLTLICSHCPEHPWQLSKYIDHCKHSIFASDSESEEENTYDYQTKELYLTTPDLKLGMLELVFPCNSCNCSFR